MSKLSKYPFLTFLILALACGDENVQVTEDPSIQRAADIEIIEQYLLDNGFTEDQVDTTELGVRYVILDSGMTNFDSLMIDESDIVDYDFIGRLTNDSLFDSSIAAVAAGTRVFDSTRVYEPLQTVYTESGWFIETQQSFFVPGFRDGITHTFGDLAIGGRSLIIIPSDLAFGGVTRFNSDGDETIPANSVVTFELLPAKIRKQ